MPAGADVTVPAPCTATESDQVCVGAWMKVALTTVSAFIVTEQAWVPEHAPPQFFSAQPVSGRASSATTLPATNWAEQVVPHSMPAGLEVILPPPETATASVWSVEPPPPEPPSVFWFAFSLVPARKNDGHPYDGRRAHM